MCRRDPIHQLRYEEPEPTADKPVKPTTRRFDEATVMRLHYHSSLEINICRDVHGTVRISDRSFDLSRIYAVILPPDTLHSYRVEASPGDD
jgi:hypothetical protein